MNLTNTQKGTLLAFIGVMIITPDTLLIRLISLDTVNSIRQYGYSRKDFLFKKLDTIKVKGKEEKIEIYSP